MTRRRRSTRLSDALGADDIDDVIELFLSEVEDVIEKLSGSEADRQLEQDMHFLKGSALNLGFDGFGQNSSLLDPKHRKWQKPRNPYITQ